MNLKNKNGLVQANDCVLVVIDVQEKLLPVVSNKETLVQNIRRLLSFSQIMNIPVLACEQIKLGSIVPEIQSEYSDMDPISKETFNCFGSEDFQKKLSGLQRQTLIITGIEAHICVTQTALTAPENYTVQVVADAIASRSEHNLQIASNRLLQAGVTLTSTEMFIFEILQRAGTEEFKKSYKLIK